MGGFIGKLLGSHTSPFLQLFRAPMQEGDVAIVNQYVQILEHEKNLTTEVLIETLVEYNKSLRDSNFKVKNTRSVDPIRKTHFHLAQTTNQLLFSRLSTKARDQISAVLGKDLSAGFKYVGGSTSLLH